eukprot:3139495-Pyramimonas_sp.AAC.1
MWRDSPGVQHRHVKPPRPVRDEHYDDAGHTYAAPSQIMDRRAHAWQDVWTDSSIDQQSILE